jgi:hypothetical protein
MEKGERGILKTRKRETFLTGSQDFQDGTESRAIPRIP